MARTKSDPRQPDFFLDIPADSKPLPRHKLLCKVPDQCDLHGLRAAWCSEPSTNGRYVYLLCGCGLALRCEPEAWENELRRREYTEAEVARLNAEQRARETSAA